MALFSAGSSLTYHLAPFVLNVMTTSLPSIQSWITQWAKGAAAQGPQSRGAPKAKTKKIHIEFDRCHAMQCFMCVQCMAIDNCRVSTVFTRTGNSHHRVSVCHTPVLYQNG